MTLDRRIVIQGLATAGLASAGLVSAGLVSGLAACSPRRPPASSSRTAIRFATDWRAEVEHGGYYAALAAGAYARRGLDVTIIQGGPGTNMGQLLAAGAAEFGVGSNSFAVMNLAAEKIPVKAVMAVFQKDPQVLMAHPGVGVRAPADLRGRPILLSDAAVGSFWPWLKAKYKLSDDQIHKYAGGPGAFLADPRAVQQGYVFSEPVTVEQAGGFKPVVMLLADDGYPGYAGMVLAPDKLIAAKPDAVHAFVEASAQGWKEYLYVDAAPADALIRRENPQMTDALLASGRDMMRTFGIVGSGDAQTLGLGAMSDAGWSRFFAMASGIGVYPKTLDFHAAYTLDFLPASTRRRKPAKAG